MKQYIPEVRIIQPDGPLHQVVQDLWLEDGYLAEPPTDPLHSADEVFASGLCISAGWVDLRARAYDPGKPERENLHSLLSAAALGGFTQVNVLPDTEPAADGRSMFDYWKRQSVNAPAKGLFTGAISKNNEGKELAELFDMKQFGGLAFSDIGIPISNTLFLKVAMEYCASVELPLLLRPDDAFLYRSGDVREGVNSHHCGMPGIPAISESIGVERLAELALYTGCKVHLTGISTLEGLERLRQWKAKGAPLTADVSIAHLTMDDRGLLHFDSLWKHHPPLPTMNDRMALLEAVQEGLIDAVCSDHHPVDHERKHCEFHLAEEGISCIQAVYPLLQTALGEKAEDHIVKLLSVGPRKVLQLSTPQFQRGEKADYTLFNPEGDTHFQLNQWSSLSQNFPFFGQMFKGHVIRTFLTQ